MKLHESNAEMREHLSKIREVLEAQWMAERQVTATSSDGRVRVKVDQRMQVTAVEFLDKSVSPEAKEALQNATVEAVNQARLQAVLSASEALTNLQASMHLKGFEPDLQK